MVNFATTLPVYLPPVSSTATSRLSSTADGRRRRFRVVVRADDKDEIYNFNVFNLNIKRRNGWKDWRDHVKDDPEVPPPPENVAESKPPHAAGVDIPEDVVEAVGVTKPPRFN
ncbi:hypothetical protein ACFE04_006041 [Oxalis oulophora]